MLQVSIDSPKHALIVERKRVLYELVGMVHVRACEGVKRLGEPSRAMLENLPVQETSPHAVEGKSCRCLDPS